MDKEYDDVFSFLEDKEKDPHWDTHAWMLAHEEQERMDAAAKSYVDDCDDRNPLAGDCYFDEDRNCSMVYDGLEWVEVAGAPFENGLTVSGLEVAGEISLADMPSDGQLLTYDAGELQWADAPEMLISANVAPCNTICFYNDGEMAVEFNMSEGTVEFGDAYDPDTFQETFWTALGQASPLALQQRINELEAELGIQEQAEEERNDTANAYADYERAMRLVE